jgi:TetR/AcrR family transcriptional repressor of nem operon
MRYPAEHKQQTRQRILRAAARQFREKGFAETGVASVMQEADLTHGGFYSHFASKDELVAEVIRSGFDRVSDRFEARFEGLDNESWLRAWVNAYLSDEHLAHTSLGCPMPALAPEIARSGPEARAAFTDLFGERLGRVARHIDAPREEAERRVLAAISQMAGALMLARAIEGPLAGRIRAAAADVAVATLTGSNGSGGRR